MCSTNPCTNNSPYVQTVLVIVTCYDNAEKEIFGFITVVCELKYGMSYSHRKKCKKNFPKNSQ